ncbi:MAG: AAA family ATPase [Actinomycetota bacterium]
MLTCPSCGRESPDDFAYCPACSKPLVPVTPAPEVRKTVTVVFCDVTGSTALGERLDPESLRDVQSRYFDAMRVAIERHGGTVEKYIGDAVMAVFGIPQLHEDDALRASRAVVAMREGLAALNKELERDRGVTIQVRIGVNTGEVVAGDPATGQALVTGDAVNVAARLEQHASPGEILLGEATHRLVRDTIDAEPVAPLELKGKDERVPAWRLLDVREIDPSALRHLGSPMVGRERQLSQLGQAFEAAVEDSSCQLFTLLGSAGVGKSRLVEEFISGLEERAAVLRGRCLPYGEGITYYPVVEAIKQAAGLADFDLPDVVEAKVCSVLEGDEHQDQVCRHVAQVMGVADARGGEETFWAIRRFFEATARDRPLVLVFDDIHWGEPTFLDLVEHIADWSRGSPILLLCMARADLLDVRPSWGGGKLNAATVSLEPLTEEQADTLIGNLVGSADLSVEVADRIARIAEGNPLFVEEIIGMLIDDGLVVYEGDRLVAAADLSGVIVPPSIQALLAARVDRLTPEERTVLEAAAVIGKDFFVGAVLDLVHEEGRARVRSDLMSLVRKELIRPEPSTLPGEDAFRFRHLLIRDSAYEAIPKAKRAELHELVADWLERVAGEAVIEQGEIVGYHLEQACEYRTQLAPADERSGAIGQRAAARLATAGRRASGRGDFPAAANLLRRALMIGPPDDAERAEILYHLGVALDEVGDIHATFAAFDEAARLAAVSGDRLEWLARIWRSEVLSNADPHSTSTQECREQLEEAIRRFEELGDEAGLATAWAKLAFLEFIPCRFDHAGRAARRAVEHARRSGDDGLLTDAIRYLLLSLCFGSGTPEEGRRTLDELTEDISRSRSLEASALAVRGSFQAMEGSFDEARRLTGLAIETAEAIGSRVMVAVYEAFIGNLEREADDAIAAERALRRNYEILDEMGQEGFKSTAAAELAQILCTLERFDEAEGFATIARNVAVEDDLSSQVFGRSAQAIVLAARGELDEAERLVREAVRMFEDAESPGAQGGVRMDLARVLRMAGKAEEAGEAAREALAFFELKGNRPSSDATRAFLHELGRLGP